MKVITVRSHKAGQGATVTACALALAIEATGHRVALATNDDDTLAVYGVATGDDRLSVEVKQGLQVFDASRLGDLDTVGLAGLVGLSDGPRRHRFDVLVTDLGDATPTRATLAAVGFTAPESVEVVRPCYLALRRSTTADNAAAESRQHVAVIREDDRALTVGDVKSVLRPAGEVIEIPHAAAVARIVDAGLLAHRLPREFDALAAWAESVTTSDARKGRRTAKKVTK